MKEEKKSHFVGLRMTGKESELLSQVQDHSKLSKTEVLLKGLELFSEYYLLGLDQGPLHLELRNLEKEALQHAESLRRARSRAKAIRDMMSELRAVDEIVDRYEQKSNHLIQILLAVQEQNHWLPQHALLWVSERLQIPLSRIYQIANFYAAFSLEPRGAHLIHVCMGTACYVRGGPQLLSRVSEALKLKPGETDPDQLFTLQTVNCLGCCALGPVLKIDDEYYSDPKSSQLAEIFGALAQKESSS